MAHAKVLRLLRHDARAWWYHQTLRTQGRETEAIVLERQSVRRNVAFIRENIGRAMITYRADTIVFPDIVRHQPFDLRPMNVRGWTSSVSGCHPGSFAAWVYCYANRIGQQWTAKTSDLV